MEVIKKDDFSYVTTLDVAGGNMNFFGVQNGDYIFVGNKHNLFAFNINEIVS